MSSRWLPLLVLAAALGPIARAAASPPPQSPDGPLPIERAVELARQRAPRALAAGVRAEGAAAAARSAGRWPNPAVEARAENWTAGHWGWTPGAAPDAPPGVDFFAVLTQPIELGGKRSSRVAVASADQAMASAAGRLAVRDTTLETIRAYVEAIRARETLAILAENAEGVSSVLGTMTSRVREGYAAESDLMKFQAERARLDAEVARTRVDLVRALAQLGALVGEPVTPARLLVPRPSALPPGETAALLVQAVERLPEVAEATARVERARGVASGERALRWPDAGISAGYKRTAGVDTAVAGIVVAVPIFDRNARGVALAESEARATELDRRAVMASATAALASQFEAARLLAAEAERASRDLLAPAEGVRTAARSSFREGAADVLKLVDAERVYLDARREALYLRLGAFQTAAEARLAIGKEIYE
jgi:outer membrane protein, heavy metal efflux system